MKPTPAQSSVRHPLSSQVVRQRCFFVHAEAARAKGLVYGGWEQCTSDYSLTRDDFPFTVLEFVESGNGSLSLNGVESSLEPGSFFIYGPGSTIKILTDPARPLTKFFLCFNRRGVARIRQTGLPLTIPNRISQFEEVDEAFQHLLNEGERQRETTPTACSLLTEVILLKLRELVRLQGSGKMRMGEKLFLNCRDRIDRDAAKLRSLKEICSLCKISPTQACRLFERYQGVSPYKYLIRRKVRLAAELLRAGDCRVKEAGEQVGFADPYHFSRVFKATLGLSPRHYANSL